MVRRVKEQEAIGFFPFFPENICANISLNLPLTDGKVIKIHPTSSYCTVALWVLGLGGYKRIGLEGSTFLFSCSFTFGKYWNSTYCPQRHWRVVLRKPLQYIHDQCDTGTIKIENIIQISPKHHQNIIQTINMIVSNHEIYQSQITKYIFLKLPNIFVPDHKIYLFQISKYFCLKYICLKLQNIFGRTCTLWSRCPRLDRAFATGCACFQGDRL